MGASFAWYVWQGANVNVNVVFSSIDKYINYEISTNDSSVELTPGENYTSGNCQNINITKKDIAKNLDLFGSLYLTVDECNSGNCDNYDDLFKSSSLKWTLVSVDSTGKETAINTGNFVGETVSNEIPAYINFELDETTTYKSCIWIDETSNHNLDLSGLSLNTNITAEAKPNDTTTNSMNDELYVTRVEYGGGYITDITLYSSMYPITGYMFTTGSTPSATDNGWITVDTGTSVEERSLDVEVNQTMSETTNVCVKNSNNKVYCKSVGEYDDTVDVTYNSNNLLYNLVDISTTTSTNMQYSVSNKVVTVTGKTADGYGYTNGRVYLEAGKEYIFSCDTSGTWGTVEAFLMLNGSTSVEYHRMDSNTGFTFTPATTGVYWLRLDVNAVNVTHTFSNINISYNAEVKQTMYGYPYGTLPTITRVGYTHNGWYNAASGGTQITSTTTMSSSSDHTIYSQWTANTYTVAYSNTCSLTKGGTTANSTHTYEVYKNLTANGYTCSVKVTYDYQGATGGNTNASATATSTFNGWATTSGGSVVYSDKASVVNLATSGTKTLYTNWTNNSVTLPTPTRTGYIFEEWNTKSDGSGTSYDAGATYTPTAAITLYAIWTPIEYNIDYTLNGGTSGTNAPTKATYDQTVTIDNPTKTVTVTGNLNNTGAAIGGAVSKSQTFAGWTSSSINTSTAYYESTAWTSTSTKVTATTFKNLTATNGSTVTMVANWTAVGLTLPTVSKSGYTCTWNTKADGTGTTYQSGASYTPSATSAAAVNMYAICTANSYTATFNASSGTVTTTSKSVTYDSAYGTLPTPTRDGYTFDGWQLVPDEYQQVDYIQSTGTQYIETGVTGTAKWEFDIQFTDLTTRQLMGYGGSGSEYWGVQTDGNYGLATWNYMNVQAGNRDNVIHNYGEDSLYYLNVNGTSVSVGKTDVSSKEYQLFAIGGGYLTKAKLYGVKTIQNGELIRNFVPCYRKSDNVVGLYDTVNDVFYTNAGSGTFTKGTDTYITSTSTVAIPANHTLYAQWTANIYTVTLDNQSATTAGTTKVYYQYNTTKTVNGVTCYYYTDSALTTCLTDGATITKPDRTGYTFVGYFTETGGSGTQYVNASGTFINNIYKTIGDRTLYANWSINSYTVTYDYNNSYTYPNPIYTDTGYIQNWDKDFTIEETIKVSTLGKRYLIIGNYNNSDTKALNIEITAANALRVYFGTGQVDKSSGTVTAGESISIVFNWTASTNTYTISATGTSTNISFSGTYDMSGSASNGLRIGTVDIRGTSATFSDITVSSLKISNPLVYATALSNLPTAVRTGYAHNGWYTASSGGTKVTTSTTIGAANTTYYAQWSAISYKITYALNGGTSGSSAPTTATYDSVATINNPTKSGYTFTGWTYSNGNTSTALHGTSSSAVTTKWSSTSTYVTAQYFKNLTATSGATVTMTAHWKKTLTATFNYYNSASTTVTCDALDTATSCSINAPAALGTPDGYTFRGWSTADTADATTSLAASGSITLSANATYYASYQQSVTATFYYSTLTTDNFTYSGHTASTTTASAVKYINYKGTIVNSNFTIPTAVTGSNGGAAAQNYKGVSSSTSSAITTTPTTANTTYYAVYYEDLVFYYYNGSAQTSKSVVRVLLCDGSTYATALWNTSFTAADSAPTSSTYDSASFVSWSYTDTSINVRTPTQTGVNALYAVHQKTITVTYNANGGSDAPASQTGTKSYIIKASGVTTLNPSITISSSKPFRDFYTFSGWNTSSDGTGTSYTAGTAYSISANITLYAKWTLTNYTLTYDYDGQTVSTANPTTYSNTSTTFTLNNPTKTGYTANWTEKISTSNWRTGFINFDSGVHEISSTYPNSVYSEYIYLESGVTYTLTGTSLGGIRWRFFGTDGTYIGNTSGETFTPSQNGYVRILLFEGCTEANRNAAVITSSQGTSVSIVKGSSGNRAYTVSSWTANKYTVTLNNQSATTAGTTSVTATYDSPMPSITVPAKTGYTFGGYYSTTSAIDLTSSLSLWSGTARISFLGTNNGWSLTTSDAGTHLQAVFTVTDSSLSSAPTLDFNDVGLTNGTHYTVSGSSGTWTYYVDFDITESMVSTRGSTPYDTTYRFIDVQGTTTSASVTVSYATKGGKKYYNASGTSTWDYDVAGATTLYAKWTANIYSVTLDNQSATTAGTTKVYYQYNTTKTVNGVTCYYYTDETLTTCLSGGYNITNPSKTGYTFGGYFTSTGGSGTQYVNASGSFINNIYQTTGDRTLYAKWTANIYAITLDNQSATTSGTTKVYYQYKTTKVVNSVTCYYYTDEALTTCLSGGYTIVLPAKNGYTFGGYYTSTGGSGTQYVNASGGFINNIYQTTGDRTLYAKWTANTYTVNYDCNGGSGAPSSQTATYGQTFTVATNTCTRTGYTFAGWYDPTNVSWTGWSGTWSYVNGQYGISDGSLTLKAKWTANTYTVNYDCGGGSGAPSSQTATYAQTFTVATNTCTRTGYTFAGWYDPTDVSWTGWSGTWSYVNGQYGISNGSLTLTAKWSDTTAPSLSLSKMGYVNGFKGWTLNSGASLDSTDASSQILSMTTTTADANSSYYQSDEQYYGWSYDFYTTTASSYYTPNGAAKTSSYYYDSNFNLYTGSNGYSSNGQAPNTSTLNTWVSASQSNYNYGTGIEYFRLSIQTGTYSSPTTKYRNFKVYGDIYAQNYTINVSASDTGSGVDTIKYASGSQSASYFASSGTTVSGSSFTVDSNNTYTVYAKDTEGNETTKTITVNKVDNTAPSIVSAYSGKMLNTDPEFASGTNGISTYCYSCSGSVTITRKSISGIPNSSGYGLEIVNDGTGTRQGFTFATQSGADKEYVTRIVAKIPSGYTISWASNKLGQSYSGAEYEWLTSTAGTGQWEEYVFRVKADSSGTFQSTNYFWINNGSAAITWYVAYATVIDTTADVYAPSKTMFVTANDTAAGIVAYAYTTANAEPTSWTRVTTNNYVTAPKTVTANGTHYVWFCDAAGNVSSQSISVTKVDSVAPTLTLSASGTTVTITSDVTNLFSNQSPSSITRDPDSWSGITNTTVVTNVTSSSPGPVSDTSTYKWEMTSDGSVAQWIGYQGAYSGIFDGSANDILMVSGYYKTSDSAGQTYLGIGGLPYGDWSGYYSTTTLDGSYTIHQDGQWHYFFIKQRVNETFTDAILSGGPYWGYVYDSGIIYMNGINWRVIPSSNTTAADIHVRKWASGSQTLSYFQSGGGTQISENTFSVSSNGTYTVYVEDLAGNGTIQTINVTSAVTSISKPTNSLCVSRTYTGSAQQLTSVTSGTGYTLSGYSQTNAGTYTITAALTSGYQWSDGSTSNATFSCSIARSKTATASAANKTYNGSSQTGVSGSAVTWSGTTTGTNVGSYTAYATPTSNYAWSDGTYAQKTISWSISAAYPSMTLKITNSAGTAIMNTSLSGTVNYKCTQSSCSTCSGTTCTTFSTSDWLTAGVTFTYSSQSFVSSTTLNANPGSNYTGSFNSSLTFSETPSNPRAMNTGGKRLIQYKLAGTSASGGLTTTINVYYAQNGCIDDTDSYYDMCYVGGSAYTGWYYDSDGYDHYLYQGSDLKGSTASSTKSAYYIDGGWKSFDTSGRLMYQYFNNTAYVYWASATTLTASSYTAAQGSQMSIYYTAGTTKATYGSSYARIGSVIQSASSSSPTIRYYNQTGNETYYVCKIWNGLNDYGTTITCP